MTEKIAVPMETIIRQLVAKPPRNTRVEVKKKSAIVVTDLKSGHAVRIRRLALKNALYAWIDINKDKRFSRSAIVAKYAGSNNWALFLAHSDTKMFYQILSIAMKEEQ